MNSVATLSRKWDLFQASKNRVKKGLVAAGYIILIGKTTQIYREVWSCFGQGEKSIVKAEMSVMGKRNDKKEQRGT